MTYERKTGGGGAGVSDHGALTGLGDDDHSQYLPATHEADTTSVHGITDTSTLYRSGGTDVAVADGGTGSSTAAGARTNLGVPASVHPHIIAEQTLSVAAAFIEFAAIPATYRHLRIEGQLRTTDAAVAIAYVSVRVGNGAVDTGATNYRAAALKEGAADYNSTGRAEFIPGKVNAATADADTFGWFEVTIEDYLTTTYWRLMHGRTQVHPTSAICNLFEGIGQWKNKADAINVVRIYPTGAVNFVAGSQLRLIGIL